MNLCEHGFDSEACVRCEQEHEAPDEGGYGLLMPFAVCESNGGPYQDHAFVQGYTAGVLDARMEHTDKAFQHYVAPALIPQLDLVAMHRGWSIKHEPWDEHPDEWTLATFTPAQAGDHLPADNTISSTPADPADNATSKSGRL